jgi:cysteine-rich repeat protein
MNRFATVVPAPSIALFAAAARCGAIAVALVALLLPDGRLAWAQDYQAIPLGQGFPDSECITSGPNLTLDSVAAGDDRSFGGSILTGDDGICDTVLASDDLFSSNGVVFGQGLPFADLVLSGSPTLNDGICVDSISPAGDDVVEIPPGQSLPDMVAVGPGGNGSVETIPGGDDIVTTLICPGNDGFQSSLDPADELPILSQRCLQLCAASLSCIVPGSDGVLDTTVNPSDIAVVYVSSGANGIGESSAAGDDAQLIAFGGGFVNSPGFERAVCVSVGADGIAQTTICGNGIPDIDENGLPGSDCEDGNTTNGDGCSSVCLVEENCGNGFVDAGEECDDANSRNNDSCIGCINAICGDGFVWQGVEQCEPPGTASCDAGCLKITPPRCGDGIVDLDEECDDANGSNRDDCSNQCFFATCGDGYVHDSGTPPFEQCDDSNPVPGDGCSTVCTEECGNGVIDQGCTAGNVGLFCYTDPDCDTAPSSGDGVCEGETCDPGSAALCQPAATVCSNVCQEAACGNGAVECDEDCDLGLANGVEGSGCDSGCARNVMGGNRELTGSKECLSAWTIDSAPSLTRRSQSCKDGDSCDFDSLPGQCTFRLGVCLNRPGVTGCTPGGLLAWDLRRLDVTELQKANAAETLTTAVAALSGGSTVTPDRCVTGDRRKNCNIPNNFECDRTFGAADGFCDVGTGVLFFPNLDPANLGGDQVATCSPSQDIIVAAGTRLRLKSKTRRVIGRSDRDAVRLRCTR